MSQANSRSPFRLTGWHVLGALSLFFGLVAAVNGVMMARAYSTYPGEVSTTPYEDGLAYNHELAREAAQQALGWRLAPTFVAANVLQVSVVDASGSPIVGLALQGRLERPATLLGAQGLHFHPVGPGLYQAQAQRLGGAWDLALSARDGRGHEFETERRLIGP
jgi:nitrogen fixation protein FixH